MEMIASHIAGAVHARRRDDASVRQKPIADTRAAASRLRLVAASR
jgi:hypothetical protein